MELGEKLLKARQKAGLSQRQLCGEEITRNMLSQIEHGTARPSMDTLKYLAARLGKPVSFFLDEDVVTSPNRQVILDARRAYEAGDAAKARLLLENYQPGDTVFQWEYRFLLAMTTLKAAETALEQGKDIYARELLEDVGKTDHGIPGVERQRLLLMGKISGADLQTVCGQLPSLDEELLLRSEAALVAGDGEKAVRLLEAAEDRTAPKWCFLRGKAYMITGGFSDAARCFHGAEDTYPRETAAYLERCYRELEDYKRAYEYACKQR